MNDKNLLEAIRRSNEKGIPFLRRHDEDEPTEDRDEDIRELSDAEYHGQHERFTFRG
jgi:hypothetical protein